MYLKLLKIHFYLIAISLIVLFSNNLYSQEEIEKSKYLKVFVSNNKPVLNEVITYKIECTAPRDLDNATIYFQIYAEGSEYENNMNLDDGIELISGEKVWHGAIKAGETIKKEISLKFYKRKVFLSFIDFRFFPGHLNLTKLIKIFVGGAFEEDDRVKRMKEAINWFKEELENPHINPFPPDTSESIPVDDNGLPIYQKSIRKETSLEDKENLRKNDSLLIKLRKEYETLNEQVEEKQRSRMKKNKSFDLNYKINEFPTRIKVEII